MQVVMQTALPGLAKPVRDEVRDIYDLQQKKQLIVYTDRMAVSGQILKKPIPYRGVMFTQISLYWISKFTHLVGHNLVAQAVQRFPQEFQSQAALLKGRSVIVQQLRDLPLKFRVVGNLAGADWSSYQKNRMVGGKTLRIGLRESDRLETPILIVTPTGDMSRQRIDDIEKWARRMYGQMLYKDLVDISLAIFGVARNYAAKRGLIIADSAFEFAVHEGTPYIINNVLNPETTTYWSKETFKPGQTQPSFDRQPLQDWLAAQGWDSSQPLPEIPKEIISETSRRYREIFNIMTGKVALPDKDE